MQLLETASQRHVFTVAEYLSSDIEGRTELIGGVIYDGSIADLDFESGQVSGEERTIEIPGVLVTVSDLLVPERPVRD
jgi:hypothetical protein